MNKPLQRHLVVGLGSIGRRHLELLRKKGLQVAAVDPYITAHEEIQLYPSLAAGLESRPDMVWLCSPTECHAEQAVQVLAEGMPLFIEKPVAHDLAGAIAILDSRVTHPEKPLVWVGCNMRFHPAVIRLKAMLAEDIIGLPKIVRIHFSHWLPNMRPGTDYRKTYAARQEGGGVVLDDIHDIDLALFFGGKAASVSGTVWQSGCLDMAAEDVASINLIHETGIFSQIHMDFLRQDKSRGIEIIGETGTLEWRSLGKNPEHAVIRHFSKANGGRVLFQEKISNFDSMFEAQLDTVLKCCEDGREWERSLDDACEALKIAVRVRDGAQREK